MDGPRDRTAAGELATTVRVGSKEWNRARPRPGAVFIREDRRERGSDGHRDDGMVAMNETDREPSPMGTQLETGRLVRAASTIRSAARLAPAMFRDTGPSSSSARGPET